MTKTLIATPDPDDPENRTERVDRASITRSYISSRMGHPSMRGVVETSEVPEIPEFDQLLKISSVARSIGTVATRNIYPPA